MTTHPPAPPATRGAGPTAGPLEPRPGQPSAPVQGAVAGHLADGLGDLARAFQAEDDTSLMLDAMVAAAVRMLPGVDEASLSLVVGRKHVRSEHPSSDLPARIDAIQTEVGEGPCLQAIHEQQTVRVPDLRREVRWPRFARRAHAEGAGSMLCFQLFVSADNLGSLNLYSRRTDAFDDESEQVGLVFASHAAVAYASAKKIDGLSRAIASRDQIGQAKGILMERYKVSDDRAFAVLVRVSQNTHRPLRDVAHELASTGSLAALDVSSSDGRLRNTTAP